MNTKTKILIVIVAVGLIVIGGWLILEGQGAERSCVNSGGTVSKSLCCKATGDFPNTCLIGACGCPPEYSHEVKTCDCRADKCFNGRKCILSKY